MWVIATGGFLIAAGFGLNVFTAADTALAMPIIVFSIVVWTTGEMFQAPFQQAVVTDLAPDELRGRYLGVFSMMYALAWAIGAPAGGAIMQTFGPAVLWKTCFYVGLTAVALYAAVRPAARSLTVDDRCGV